MKRKTERKNKIFTNFFYDLAVITGAVPGLIWLRPKRIYASSDAKKRIKGGAIIVSNHVSLIDPVYIMFAVWYRRHRFICMDELLVNPLAKLFFRLARCIAIDRNNISISSFREITDALKQGGLISMFPEGRINETSGSVDDFKSGAILMSIMSGKPIVPVYIVKPKRFFNRLICVFGEQIDPIAIYGRRPSSAQLAEMTQFLHSKELELMNLYEENNK